MRSVGFAPDIAFSLIAKSYILVSSDQSTLFHMFGESPTLFLANTKYFLIFFIKEMFFYWPVFCKAQFCGVYYLKWTHGQILQYLVWCFVAPWVFFGLFVASLINALLDWSVSFGGRPSLGRFVVMPYSLHFENNGFNGALWDVQRFWYFFLTQPWSVLLHTSVPDLLGELLGLHSAACLVVPLT